MRLPYHAMKNAASCRHLSRGHCTCPKLSLTFESNMCFFFAWLLLLLLLLLLLVVLSEQAVQHRLRRHHRTPAGVSQVSAAAFHVLPAAALPAHHPHQDADRGELHEGTQLCCAHKPATVNWLRISWLSGDIFVSLIISVLSPYLFIFCSSRTFWREPRSTHQRSRLPPRPWRQFQRYSPTPPWPFLSIPRLPWFSPLPAGPTPVTVTSLSLSLSIVSTIPEDILPSTTGEQGSG